MKALCFGAVLWDVIGGDEFIGGAPFNLAAHLAQMGAQARLISRVGTDRRGAAARAAIQRLSLDVGGVQVDPAHPTGWVDVTLAEGQPTFTIHEDVAFDHIEVSPELLKAVATEPVDVFCYGTLEQRAPVSRKALHRLLAVVPAKIFFYDVNLRQHYYALQTVQESLVHSTMVKLNEAEVGVLGQLLHGSRLPEAGFADLLMTQYPRVRTVCVTKGAAGCTVYREGRALDCPGVAVSVADTVGAGDAFSAAFLLKYCAGWSPVASAAFANRIGAFVASQRGAVPAYSPEIRALINATEDAA